MSGPPAALPPGWADQPNTVTIKATCTPPASAAFDLAPVSGSVTWDAADRWRTSAQLVVPFELAVWQAVKDFSQALIRVEAGCVLPSGAVVPVPLSGPLVVRVTAVSRPEDTITLTLASQASTVDDLRFTADTAYPAGDGGTKIKALITAALPSATYNQSANGPGLAGESNAGSGRWSAVEAVADYAALEVWQDTDDRFVIRAQPVQTGSPVDELKVGAAGNLIQSSSDFNRDTFANAYAVRSAWVNSNGQTDYAFGIAYNNVASDPLRWGGPAGSVVQSDVENLKLTNAECQQIAVQRLRRTLGHGRGVRVTCPIRPWLRPGDPISVELPTGGVQVHTVQRVEHDLAAFTTVIDTRLLPE